MRGLCFCCRTATNHIRRIYNEHVLMNKRTSLDCEAAFAHGTLPRTISTGTGIAGVFKRKRSVLNLPGNTPTDEQLLEPLRRSMRVRRVSADQSDCDRVRRQTVYGRISHHSGDTPCISSQSQHRVRSTDSTHNSQQPSQANVLANNLRADEGTVIERRYPHAGEEGHTCAGQATVGSQGAVTCPATKTVEKLAKLTGEVIFSPTAIAEIRQEIALSQLSMIVDLPILEGLVCAGSGSKDEPGYDNTVFFNVEQQHSMGMGLHNTDAWVRAAIHVFDYMPSGHKTTFDYQVGLNPSDYKLALYRSILKSYRGRADSLFPSCHEQIHLAVLSLVLSGAERKALLAMRLAAILLPCYLMAEVTTLLEFLHIVSICPEPHVKASHINSDAVLNDFASVFFMGCKILSMDQRRILLLLMMRYCDMLGQVPVSVQTALEQTMQNLKRGNDNATPSTMFCDQLSTQQYDRQQKESTEKAIVALIQSIIDDTTIPLKEKQKKIKTFSKHHSDIMLKHFCDIA